MMDNLIKPHERVDDLHRNGYQLIQDPERFCFGVDAVLLSGFAHVKKNERVLDLGTGTGVIPILMEAKAQGGGQRFYGLEIQEESVEMARRSVLLNGLQEKIEICHGDIKEADKLFQPASFHVITSNPPYISPQGGLKNPSGPKAISRHEILCTLEDVIRAAARLLKTGGSFYMVHRPHRLTDIMVLLRLYHLEPKALRFVHSYQDKEPVMVLIGAVRGGRAMIKVQPPLVIYQENGQYTDEIVDIYYH